MCQQLHHTTLHGALTIQSTPPLLTFPDPSTGIPQCLKVPIHDATVCEKLLQDRQSTTPLLLSSDSLNSGTMTSNHSQSNPMLLKTAITLAKNGTVAQEANIFFDEGSFLFYITTKFAKELCIKPHGIKTVHINSFGDVTSTNTYPVGSVSIITDEGEIRRHCAVYGTLSLVLCDNAKTFVKGEEEIQKLFQVIKGQGVQQHFTQKRIQMRHIPAKSPHWGGTVLCKSNANEIRRITVFVLANFRANFRAILRAMSSEITGKVRSQNEISWKFAAIKRNLSGIKA